MVIAFFRTNCVSRKSCEARRHSPNLNDHFDIVSIALARRLTEKDGAFGIFVLDENCLEHLVNLENRSFNQARLGENRKSDSVRHFDISVLEAKNHRTTIGEQFEPLDRHLVLDDNWLGNVDQIVLPPTDLGAHRSPLTLLPLNDLLCALNHFIELYKS